MCVRALSQTVSWVLKYADAIVKNFANSSVMALLIVISYYFFALQTNLHSWLGVVIVLTTTYCYMNIAVKLPRPGASVSEASTPVGVARPGAEEEGACEDTKLLEMPHSRSPRGVR